jgi:hypothetical protein
MGFVQKLAMSHEKKKKKLVASLTQSNGKITWTFGNGGWQNPSSPRS